VPLSEQFSSVTVVERDRLPDNSIPRRGVPQGRHLHSLLSRGSQALARDCREAAHHDIVVTERLMRVTNLVDPPQRLLEPPLLARVLIHHTRQSMARRLRR
jgi:hypothetical protein